MFGHRGLLKDEDGLPAADRNALGVLYRPAWPKTAPVMLMAESLTMPKRGLPAIRGHQSLEVLYQQSTQQSGAGSTNKTVVLHDPTRAKKFFLGGEDATFLNKIPDSVKTSSYRGKTYFPNLPPHLSERFFLDPNEGGNGALVFVGQFVDEALGDDYLMLNVIAGKDKTNLLGLCSDDDTRKTDWNNAIDGMQTTLELFGENRAKPGTFIPTSNEVIGEESLPEIMISGNDSSPITSLDVGMKVPGLALFSPNSSSVVCIPSMALFQSVFRVSSSLHKPKRLVLSFPAMTLSMR